MKFIHYLKTIAGVEIYPLVGILLCGSFFIGVVIYAYASPKKSMEGKALLPLD